MHKTFPADKTANWCKKVKVCAQMLVHFCFGAKKTTAMILVYDVQSNERKVKNGTSVGTQLHEHIYNKYDGT